MKADVYRNLNKDRKFSIRSREENDYGVVKDYVDFFYMKNPSFVVQDSGYQRYKEDEEKNVFAFVRGDIILRGNFPSLAFSKDMAEKCVKFGRVYYNPDANKYFIDQFNNNVHQADDVIGICGRILATNLKP